MFRSSMRSSSGSSLFTSLSMLLILKFIKIFKKYYHILWLCGSICLVRITGILNICCHITTMDGNILIIFNISNIDREVSTELPEDDLIEDRNMLECFLKFF